MTIFFVLKVIVFFKFSSSYRTQSSITERKTLYTVAMQNTEWSEDGSKLAQHRTRQKNTQEHVVSEKSRDENIMGNITDQKETAQNITVELTREQSRTEALQLCQKSARNHIWCQYGGAWMIAVCK